jgi:DNA replication protein DnaC
MKRRKAMQTMKAKTTDQTTSLCDRCLSHFATLRIPIEAAARRERAVARRIREARFAENKTMEGFDWTFNPKTFDRVQLEELATGDFIRRKANLVMVGWSGIGKSHIIQALGQKACVHGYRVLYRTSAQLLADLTLHLPTRLFRRGSATTPTQTG